MAELPNPNPLDNIIGAAEKLKDLPRQDVEALIPEDLTVEEAEGLLKIAFAAVAKVASRS